MPRDSDQLELPLPEEQRRWPGEGRDEALGGLAKKALAALSADELAEKVEVVWNPRMRSTAGRAHWPSARIELNPFLQKISAEEVERTMLHELAHLLAYFRHGVRTIRAHGPEWQKACRDLGIAGESVTHQLPLPRRRMRRRWRYKCPHCHLHFDRVRRYRVKVACRHCCRKKNGGKYHPLFHLVEERLG